MEAKLRDFKSRRRREILMNKPKEFFNGIKNMISFKSKEVVTGINETHSVLIREEVTSEKSCVMDGNEDSILSVESSNDISLSLPVPSWLTIMSNTLYFLLWLILYLIAVHFEFGFVYFVISGLFFIYFNTRTGPKQKGEISAYSVFNPGCESIQGTYDAKQVEREFNLIRHEPESPYK